jgi:hydrogenase maturation protease
MSILRKNPDAIDSAEPHTLAWPQKVTLMGLGHVLMGDDGFGPLVVEMFRCSYACLRNVEIIDLGTPGLDMTPYLYGSDLVILVDCVRADREPGSLHIYREREITGAGSQLHLTGHDPGLQESLVQLKMTGHGPSELLILGVVPQHCNFGQPMSASVLRAALRATKTIACLMEDHGIDCLAREPAFAPDLWWFPAVAAFSPLGSSLQSPRQPTGSEIGSWQHH